MCLSLNESQSTCAPFYPHAQVSSRLAELSITISTGDQHRLGVLRFVAASEWIGILFVLPVLWAGSDVSRM